MSTGPATVAPTVPELAPEMDPRPMSGIVDDLVAEQAAVDVLLDPLTEEQWDAPAATCAWTLKEELLHIAAFDWAATRLLVAAGEGDTSTDVTALADANFGHDDQHRVTRFSHLPGAEVLDRWRELRSRLVTALLDADPKARVPWAPGLPMAARSLASARHMELWAHSVDLTDALGRAPITSDRIASTLFLSWQARPNAYRINDLELPATPVRLELTMPSGAPWAKGEPDAADVVRGAALDWALVATRRRRWQDTGLEVVGDEARRYADVVQSFAGAAAQASAASALAPVASTPPRPSTPSAR